MHAETCPCALAHMGSEIFRRIIPGEKIVGVSKVAQRVGVWKSHSEALTGNKIAWISKTKILKTDDGIVHYNSFGMHDASVPETSYQVR